MLNISLLWFYVPYNTVTNIITVLEVFKKKLDGNNLVVFFIVSKKGKVETCYIYPEKGVKDNYYTLL